MHRAILLAVPLATALATRSAHAAPTSRLVYSHTRDADSCPDEQALRRAVAARVGYDPFFAWATRTIVASLARRDHAFVATVDLVDDKGVSHGARELRTEGECGELLDAVALAIAIAIDPQSLTRPSEPPPEPPPPGDPPPEPPVFLEPPATRDAVLPPAAPPPAPGRHEAPSLDVTVGSVVSSGVAPGPAAGLSVGAGLGWSAFSLALEGRVDAPASTSASGGGEVTSWLALGALVPCVHFGPAFGCVVGQGGSAQASSSGVPATTSKSVAWWASGVRLGAVARIQDSLSARIRGDLLADLDPATLRLNGGDVWTAPLVAASLGVDLLLHFQ